MSHPVERPAFGQKAGLGTFYNAHTDTFQGMSLFLKHLPVGTVETSQNKKTSAALSFDSSHKGRFDLLGVSPGLGASFFSGLAPAGGSGKFFLEESKVTGDAAGHTPTFGAVHHRITTAQDTLQLNNPALREHVGAVSLSVGEFTHVVTGIEWGCQTVIAAKYVAQHDDPSRQESFHRAINGFKAVVEELQYVPDPNLCGIEGVEMELDIVAYSEVFLEDGVVMESLKEAFDFIKLLPSLLQHGQNNSGKGEPISYTLLPIRTVTSILQLQGATATGLLGGDSNLLPTKHDFLNAVLNEFDEIASLQSRLTDYSGFLARHRSYVPLHHIQEVEAAVVAIKGETANLKKTYGNLLTQVRMSGPDQAAMDSLLDSLRQLRQRYARIPDSAPEQRTKVGFVSAAVAQGAVYVGYNGLKLATIVGDPAAPRRRPPQRDYYVFKFNQTAMTADAPAWDANVALLEDLLATAARQPTKVTVVVLDCDAIDWPLEQVQIAYHDYLGREVTQDLHEQRQFEADQSFAICDAGALESGEEIQKPVQRRMVKIPCPGANCNKLQVCHWICAQCHEQLEFGFSDDYLYCGCGRAKFNRWRFKCNNPNHAQGGGGGGGRPGQNNSQTDYVAYTNEAQLLSTLKSLDQTDYVNILILGETGVGKSTFINSFVNYLSFETLEEAKRAEELNWVIPCSFSIQSMDRSQPNGAIVERKIQVGVRDDEADGSGGASATQQTAVYPVNIGTKTIRLIDTPGIGDTRGLAYDKKNMADILRTLSAYEQLHGVLILLKSNNSRLTITFNFCMQELLTHLHRSATRNMAFGFTNTRISNYSPGDTFGPLSSLLQKHKDVGFSLQNQNTYCFDSESFRFLAAFKHDVYMENEEDFRRSWEHSRAEAVRLVQYFETRTPHQVKSTMSLNGTRQLIAELTKPMADISQLINTNINLCKDKMQELRDTRLSGEKLRERLQVPKKHLKLTKLNHPRTVCRNPSCVEWSDDGTGTVRPIYKVFCHDPCYLDNIEVDRVNYPELLQCYAFYGQSGVCREPACKHTWQEHLHVITELEEYTAMVDDTEAQRLFRENADDITVKQTVIRELEQRVDEYRAEHRQIQEAAARFCIFLEKHAITPYNDATLEYLDMLIQEEEQKARVSRDKTKLDDLRKDYNAHVELVGAMSKGMAAGSTGANTNMLDEAGVEAEVRRLYSLPHFGAMLRDVKDGLIEAHQATYRERPFRVQGRHHHHGQRKAGRTNGSSAHHSHASHAAGYHGTNYTTNGGVGVGSGAGYHHSSGNNNYGRVPGGGAHNMAGGGNYQQHFSGGGGGRATSGGQYHYNEPLSHGGRQTAGPAPPGAFFEDEPDGRFDGHNGYSASSPTTYGQRAGYRNGSQYAPGAFPESGGGGLSGDSAGVYYESQGQRRSSARPGLRKNTSGGLSGFVKDLFR